MSKQIIGNAVLHVCLARDIECGDFSASWCAACPKRRTQRLPQRFVTELTPGHVDHSATKMLIEFGGNRRAGEKVANDTPETRTNAGAPD